MINGDDRDQSDDDCDDDNDDDKYILDINDDYSDEDAACRAGIF